MSTFSEPERQRPLLLLDSSELPHVTQAYLVPSDGQIVPTIDVLAIDGVDTEGVQVYLSEGDDVVRWSPVTEWGPLGVGSHPLVAPTLCAAYFRLIVSVVVLGSGAVGTALVSIHPGAESVLEAEARAHVVTVPDLVPAEPQWPRNWPEVYKTMLP